MCTNTQALLNVCFYWSISCSLKTHRVFLRLSCLLIPTLQFCGWPLLVRGRLDQTGNQTHCTTTGAQEVSLQLRAQTRLLRALSCQSLHNSETAQPLWVAVLMSSWGNCFSLYLVWSYLKFCLWLLLLQCFIVKNLSPLPCWLPLRCLGSALRCPLKLFLTQARQILSLSFFLQDNSTIVMAHPELVPVCQCLSYFLRAPKLEAIFRCISNWTKGENHVPQSPGCAPISTSPGCWWPSHKPTRLPVYQEHPVPVVWLMMKLSVWKVMVESQCRVSDRSVLFECMQLQQTAVALIQLELQKAFYQRWKESGGIKLCKKWLWSKQWDLGFCAYVKLLD